MRLREYTLPSRGQNLGRATPAALFETLALKAMITVCADAEEFTCLDLAHCRVVNYHGIRY